MNPAPRRFIRVGAMLALGFWIVGCSLTTYHPEVAGVVQSKTPATDGLRYDLANGDAFLASAGSHNLGGSQPQVGDLLLAGTKPEPWVYRLALQPEQAGVVPAGCYLIEGDVRADATFIYANVHDAALGDLTLAFPKGAGWRDSGFITSDVLRGTHTCIDAGGTAFAHF